MASITFIDPSNDYDLSIDHREVFKRLEAFIRLFIMARWVILTIWKDFGYWLHWSTRGTIYSLESSFRQTKVTI